MPENNRTHCLSLEELEQLLGNGDQNARLKKHIDQCAQCAAHLAELRENNALMDSVISEQRRAQDDLDVPAGSAAPAVSVAGYEIENEIHRGGQGVVFRAYHHATKRAVALKIILQGSLATSKQRHRFEREIEVVAALRHPNVVTVYDSGTTEDGQLYFAMEYIDGVPLDTHFLAGPTTGDGLAVSPPTLDASLGLFCRICDGVIHAHRRGVMHRDLKPSNIMVDRAGEPHVLDFGLAKAVEDDAERSLMTAPGEFMGTLAYAAPEQVQGDLHQIDIRTDVYALGIVLYEMLTGQRPFARATSMSDVIKAITEVDPDPPILRDGAQGRAGALSSRRKQEIDAIVLKALAKEPDRRYQSVEQFRRDIEQFLNNEPIDAKRDSTWYVFRKTLRRYRAAAAVSLVFVLFVIGFGITMSVLYGRAVVAEEQAERQASRATAVNKFLVDMLESADPKGGSPSDMTIRQLLDDIAGRIATELEGQPHVAAAVHGSVGNTYRNLALFKEAEHHLRASVREAEKAVGDQHSDYANSLGDLALLLNDQGQYDEAEALLRDAIVIIEATKGDNSTELATARGNLGGLMYAKGDFGSAEALFKKTLAHDRVHLDPDSPDIVFSLVNLAAVTAANENFHDAVALYREALALLQRVFGDEGHPLMGTVMGGLAISLESIGEMDASEQMHRNAIGVSKKFFGDQHPDVTEGMVNLANMLRDSGKNLDEAKQLLTEALAIQRKVLGPDHPKVAYALNDLARLNHATGDYSAAEPSYRASLSILRKTFPNDHWEIAYVESPLGATLVSLSRFDEAEKLLTRSHETIAEVRGAAHAATRKSASRLIELYDRWHEANPSRGFDASAKAWRGRFPQDAAP